MIFWVKNEISFIASIIILEYIPGIVGWFWHHWKVLNQFKVHNYSPRLPKVNCRAQVRNFDTSFFQKKHDFLVKNEIFFIVSIIVLEHLPGLVGWFWRPWKYLVKYWSPQWLTETSKSQLSSLSQRRRYFNFSPKNIIF